MDDSEMQIETAPELLAPDDFPLQPNDPLEAAQRLLHRFLEEVPLTEDDRLKPNPADYPHGQKILAAQPQTQIEVLFACAAWHRWSRTLRGGHSYTLIRKHVDWQTALGILEEKLLRLPLPFDEDQVCKIIRISRSGLFWGGGSLFLSVVERFAKQHELTPTIRAELSSIRHHFRYQTALSIRIGQFLGERNPLQRGDHWTENALDFLMAQPENRRQVWNDLFNHAANSDASKPSAKWLSRAKEILSLVGASEFQVQFLGWSRQFGKREATTVDSAAVLEANHWIFKGLVWFSTLVPNLEISPALGSVTVAAFRSVQSAGPFAVRVGNACIWALGESGETSALVQIGILKTKVRNGSLQKIIEKTFQTMAARLEVTPEDLEEIAVPDFGLENGVIARDFGEVRVEIAVSSGKAVWNWTSAGKSLKAAPASVKRDFAIELKELKVAASELEKVFAAQKERLDSLLRAEKSWEFSTWKSRYLEHPLMALLSRRVIWSFESDDQKIVALPRDGGFVDASGAAVSIPASSRVKIWHPIFDSTENVLNWRRYFEDSAQKQPFKQAHREIYRLTDAERQTRTYSNRFAAHILKQHQFNSLCAARGWKNSLRLMVDDEYPPASKIWPHHKLRAEFWIEGIGDDYGTDTNETGTYLRVATDQVRFHNLEAPQNTAHAGGGGYGVGYRQTPVEALELSQIPDLVLSETLRDVDLFVGVASLGADQNWSDGGPNGHFRNYWQEYSFGELGETAKSRADVLSRLLPRLKIHDAVSIEGRFLRVQGKKRAYKIHLGSGNILMEPNDQYLCIVPTRDEHSEVFLPFEGDKTLAVILSKAFLLFEDDKIRDASIVRQISE